MRRLITYLRDSESCNVEAKLKGVGRGARCFEDAFAIRAAQYFVWQAGAGARAAAARAATDNTL